MTRLWTTGGEGGGTLFWDVVSTLTNVTTAPRTGSYHYSIPGASSVPQKNITPALSEFYLRMPRYLTIASGAGSTKLLVWKAGSTELGSLRVNGSTQKIEIYTGTATLVGTGTHALAISTWYNIEVHIKIDNSAGAIDVRLDGTSEVTFSGDTMPGSDTTVDNLVFPSVQTGASYMDDMALNDTNGTFDNSWCGDGKVYFLTPNAAGDATGLTASTGANYTCVDDVPSNTTDYVYSSTAGLYDLYNLSTLTLGAGEVVLRVQPTSVTLEETAAGDSIALGVKTVSVETWGSNQAVTQSYARYYGTDHRVNPTTGNAWTQAQLDALQVGVKVI